MPDDGRRRFLCCAAACAGVMGAARADDGEHTKAERAVVESRLQALRHEAAGRALYGKKLVERFGTAALDAVKEVTFESGRAIGRDAGATQHGLDGLVEVWKGFPPVVAYTVDERTPTSLRIEVTRCVFAEEMRKHGAIEIGYAYYCHSDYGFGETYDSGITFERTKTLMQGHDCCDPTYRLRKQG